MGNCNGFCVTSNNVQGEESSQVSNKRVTADKVKSALQEKDELFREGDRYFDNATEQALATGEQ